MIKSWWVEWLVPIVLIMEMGVLCLYSISIVNILYKLINVCVYDRSCVSVCMHVYVYESYHIHILYIIVQGIPSIGYVHDIPMCSRTTVCRRAVRDPTGERQSVGFSGLVMILRL